VALGGFVVFMELSPDGERWASFLEGSYCRSD